MVAISASMKAMAWFLQMGLPNCTRSLEYLMASSRQPWAKPMDWADTPRRPPSSVFMALMKPMFSLPSMSLLWTRTSSSTTSEVA